MNPTSRRIENGEERTANETTLSDSLFSIRKMDCPSEEQMIRLALDDLPSVQKLQFDLSARQLRIVHSGATATLLDRLEPLKFGATLLESHPVDIDPANINSESFSSDSSEADEARVLKILLGINLIMFVIELTIGWAAESTGLIADSLDMFADAGVYGLSLYAVGRAAHHKLRAAHLSGWMQIILAFGALFEVGRRFWFGSDPDSPLMIGIGLLALAANVTCLALISRHREGGVHMKASLIFSANDVLANLGVIIAGFLVVWSGSRYPDLVIGAMIGAIVLSGALRILRLRP